MSNTLAFCYIILGDNIKVLLHKDNILLGKYQKFNLTVICLRGIGRQNICIQTGTGNKNKIFFYILMFCTGDQMHNQWHHLLKPSSATIKINLITVYQFEFLFDILYELL